MKEKLIEEIISFLQEKNFYLRDDKFEKEVLINLNLKYTNGIYFLKGIRHNKKVNAYTIEYKFKNNDYFNHRLILTTKNLHKYINNISLLDLQFIKLSL